MANGFQYYQVKDLQGMVFCPEGSDKDVKNGNYTPQYSFLPIKKVTAKAVLFNINGVDFWCPLSVIQRNRHTCQVFLGKHEQCFTTITFADWFLRKSVDIIKNIKLVGVVELIELNKGV